MRFNRIAVALALGLVSTMSVAADADQAIRNTLKAIDPTMAVEAIAESPMPGVYQVELAGGRQLYTSADGQFLLQGYLFQVKNGKPVNLTEAAESRGVVKLLDAIPASEMVVFAPKQPKTHITVFTDTDCGYCQKLHSEVPELNRLGVEVRYLAFPRQGLESEAAKELSNVWCAKDQQDAMNRAKSRQSVADAQCDSPVAKQFALGQMIGVSGTPAIVLANGKIIPGYQPAPQLAKIALESK
ncbi:bifunctional protein-disulfide isomerase/oxidoreductase DsbC [Pseudomonas leptonychotis]|uniref:Thiol:disulfide interchange protein n=1 Tax=Pseudomonas leptonychotis TaxID=2448482 RepID=A0A4T2A1B6_9PSED|nr:bifunctional protein-disulfide isomerase/oxidoreductase DsbC [Pseudomonas leptonychotis]TIH09518.1 bifunctional protein-disulfide isomerase/oxidoreductase DsbC [Pseudomonas leptonychotis]